MTSISGSTSNDGPKDATPTLPPWVHDFFTREIAELKQAFTLPLIGPSIIRLKYLKALKKHVSPDLCTFCARVHIMKGEWYCMKLEQLLAHARAKASTPRLRFERINMNIYRSRLKASVISAQKCQTSWGHC